MNIIPTNPIRAMASSNTLQVVVFAFFTGFALILIGEKGRNVKDFIISAAHLVFKMVELVIKLTPYGVFALMAWVVGEYGLGVIFVLGKFAAVVCGALSLQYMLFGVMLLIIGLNPIPFYKKMTNIQALAFATASSKATISTAMLDLRTKMGVSKQSASFILPLGASMNMDATAIYLGICAVFFAQIIGVELTLSQYLIIIATSTIGSIGAAGFPGGGMIMMGMVLSSVGLPLEGMSLLVGIDRFLDMLRTAINITGDCTVTIMVDKMDKSLDEKIYNS
jgi:Na+/H+-dicarboxylate symporter